MKNKSFIQIIGTELKRMLCLQPVKGVISVAVCFFAAALSAGYTVFFKELVERLSFSEGKEGMLQYMMQAFLIFSALLLLKDLINAVLNYQLDKQRMYLQGSLKTVFFRKVQEIPVIEFEKADILDALNKANVGMEGCVSTLVYLEIILGNSVFYMVLITGYLASIHPLLSLVVLSVLIPTAISYFIKRRLRDEAENQSAVLRRRMKNAEVSVCNREYFKETRHLQAVEYFKKRYTKAMDEYISVRKKEARRRYHISLLLDFSRFLGFMLTMALMCFLVYKKEISVGSVAAVIVTVNTLYSQLNEMFGYHIAGVVDAYTGLKNFHKIMCMDVPEKESVEVADFKNININNVSFRYPNAEKNALNNINLQITKGETICVVGENGSGKSTLSKILLGLYAPTEGNVSLNGTKISDSLMWRLRDEGTAVFQDYNSYALSLEENIFVGDIMQLHNVSTKDVLQEQCIEYLAEQLLEKEKTMLSKEFGGTDLSQGQWQRIAIARGMLKSAGFIIMDEPTAAIDPQLEMELLQRMLRDYKHATKVIITHRIGIATKADRILVMEHGELTEQGTHEELMKKNGEYARLFRLQSQWYQ